MKLQLINVIQYLWILSGWRWTIMTLLFSGWFQKRGSDQSGTVHCIRSLCPCGIIVIIIMKHLASTSYRRIQRLKFSTYTSLINGLICFARFPMSSLSKFAECLHRQYMQLSPLMGQITNILDQNLSTIDDPRCPMKMSRFNCFIRHCCIVNMTSSEYN